MALTAQQQAALYYARKQRRMKTAKLKASGDLTVENSAAVGTVVGSLSILPSFGAYSYELTDDADGLFELDGTDIKVKASLAGITEDTTKTLEAKATDASGNVFTLSVGIDVTAS